MTERLESEPPTSSVLEAIQALERYEQNAKEQMAQITHTSVRLTGHIIHYPPSMSNETTTPEPVIVAPVEPEGMEFPPSDEDSHWQAQAACKPQGKASVYDERDIFYGGRDDEYLGIAVRHKLEKEAKKLCGKCAVTAACLQYALDHDERFGIWGGLGEAERRKLQRK